MDLKIIDAMVEGVQDIETRSAFGNRAVVDAVCRSRLRAATISGMLVSVPCGGRPLLRSVNARFSATILSRCSGVSYCLATLRAASQVRPDIRVNRLDKSSCTGIK
jgi:hypothetical protein